VLTFDQIKELIELVAARGLDGLEVERSGFRLKIDGHRAGGAAPAAGDGASPSAAPAVPAAAAAPAPPAGEAAGPPAGSHVLDSPIVGTFYRAPAPGADPIVEVGARVRIGQVLCIVEAMKILNEIESDVAGVVLEIYPQNAQPVEFGEPLFAIRPD
jgi:acetyl-CoA carboxylase biotin carboxyl carrier protein